MASPFPGMDPYLEGSGWMTTHTGLSVEIARQLTPLLPDRYTALLNEWFVVAMPQAVDGVMVGTASGYPDAYVADIGVPPRARRAGPAAVMVIDPPSLRLATTMPEKVRHVTVEIRDVESRRVVTAIEVLSPANKRGEGRREYLRTRRRLLLSSTHLMEIDLLRRGRRVPMQAALPDVPYFVFLSRADRRPLTDIWPVRLDQPLPTVPVPLLDDDPDVPLDLQQTLTGMYEGLRFDRNVDYQRPPRVRLSPEESAWADERLRPWRDSRSQT